MNDQSTPERAGEPPESDALDRLEAAREGLEEIERRIDEAGGDAVADAAESYDRARHLLDSYVDRATGTGRENFKAYVQLEGQFAALVEGAPDAVEGPFEAAFEAIDKRRLSESDFERAEAALEPAERYAELIAEREAARAERAEAESAARRRIRTIDEEIDRHERLFEFADVPVDAPVEALRSPIEAYNEAIERAFRTYRREVSAREVFAFLDRTRWYPFVEYERPPRDLEAYVEENAAGEYSIPKLLEYAEYSRSKLDHYVDDAGELKRRVATERTYLDGIDADPLTVPWPPEPAGVLRRRTRELVPLVSRVLDGAGDPPGAQPSGSSAELEGETDPVSLVRTVHRLTYRDDFEAIQQAAVAIEHTTEDERRRLAAGEVEADRDRLRRERAVLQAALDDE